MTSTDDGVISAAARAVHGATSLLIGAGAGMGVDSGLPDFRGPEGFWRAYPALRGHRFEEMANPMWFDRDPTRAWGFYGHRLNLYRDVVPHAGFGVLRAWAAARDTFVFTSNVDGQFQKAGFDEAQVCECHGSIHWLQPVDGHEEDGIVSADPYTVVVDEETVRAAPPLPRDAAGGLLRPNVLMFGDYGWLHYRTEAQHDRMADWARRVDPRSLVVVEIGAGTAIPSVRSMSERWQQRGATLVRINPREAFGPAGTLSVAMGGAEGLTQIDAALSGG